MKHLLLALLLLTACINDQSLQYIPDSEGLIHEHVEIDVLLVLDNSCSMQEDWGIITYGLARISEDLSVVEADWQLALTSTDPGDVDLFIDITHEPDPGWATITAIDTLRATAQGTEAGFSAALTQYERHRPWFRGTLTMLVFVSDEKEQSDPAITSSEFLASWPTPLTVASIVGPHEPTEYMYDPAGSNCYAEDAPTYREVADQIVDICTTSPWGIVFPLTE